MGWEGEQWTCHGQGPIRSVVVVEQELAESSWNQQLGTKLGTAQLRPPHYLCEMRGQRQCR